MIAVVIPVKHKQEAQRKPAAGSPLDISPSPSRLAQAVFSRAGIEEEDVSQVAKAQITSQSSSRICVVSVKEKTRQNSDAGSLLEISLLDTIKSTSPPGTAQAISARTMQEEGAQDISGVAMQHLIAELTPFS
jgi:hypothetical protein